MGKKKNVDGVGTANKRSLNKGAWTPEEDTKLAQYIHIHGPRRWKTLAIKAGLKRCGKSCRLRWLNYLRPDIKRGNISDAEDDLILRLHRLLGNRWSLIAGRLPGRTDNEIKNYWNAHLRKKAKLVEKLPATSTATAIALQTNNLYDDEKKEAIIESSSNISSGGDNIGTTTEDEQLSSSSDDELFDFSTQGTYGLEWVKTFLELAEEDPSNLG